MLKFWQFTDTHFFHRDPMPDDPPHSDQKAILESGEILDMALRQFIEAPDCDILLISGDLTCNGHAHEHRALIEKLRAVQKTGKRVYVITATHDYGLGEIDEENTSGLPVFERPDCRVFRGDLAELYHEFGFADAIAVYDDGLSYVAQLDDQTRLFALNDDGNGRSFCGFDEKQMAWILEQIAQAKADGQYIVGMSHHPSQPPSPIYPMISQRDMMGNWNENTRALANAGLRCLFTGHAHMHNIAPIVTPEGNRYWDINTACLVGYPGVFRTAVVKDGHMTVTTEAIQDTLAEKYGGVPLRERLKEIFDFLLRDIIESAAEDLDRLADHAGGFSVERETIYKHGRLFTTVGKVVNKVTLGTLGKVLLCGKKVPESVRGVKFKDAFLELVRNIYAGEEHYSKETDLGKALTAIAGQIPRVFKNHHLPNGGMGSFNALVYALLYDPTPDDRVEIDL
ncbi:MAG: metallophosphoesterase [Oscillospiraceae bacterium]|jgi:hypothetical protein|nr:metallophosphoesterase [Oscillospiraceae bacterium]